MKNFLPLLIMLFVAGCSGKSNTGKNSLISGDEFFKIDYEAALLNKKELKLSDIASDVQYIRLATNDSCLLRPVIRYYFTDSLIFVRNFDHILKLSRDGRFLQRIGKPGRGPGEIDLIRIMSVIPEKRLIIIQLNYVRKLYYLSFEGELLRTVDFGKEISAIRVCPDGNYLLHERGAEGYEKYTFCLTTPEWDTLSVVRNYMNWQNTSGMVISIGYPSFESFYLAGNKVYMKDMYNDTIYCADGNRIRPAYYLDLGEYMLPRDLRPEKLGANQMSQFRDNSSRYYFGTMHESGGKIFIATYNYGGKAPRYVLYDRLDGSATFLSDGSEPARGFINDWDGAADFWPVGSISGKQVFMPINVLDLQKLVTEKKMRPSKHDDKQKELEQMISELQPTDNPVLMVVTLK